MPYRVVLKDCKFKWHKNDQTFPIILVETEKELISLIVFVRMFDKTVYINVLCKGIGPHIDLGHLPGPRQIYKFKWTNLTGDITMLSALDARVDYGKLELSVPTATNFFPLKVFSDEKCTGTIDVPRYLGADFGVRVYESNIMD